MSLNILNFLVNLTGSTSSSLSLSPLGWGLSSGRCSLFRLFGCANCCGCTILRAKGWILCWQEVVMVRRGCQRNTCQWRHSSKWCTEKWDKKQDLKHEICEKQVARLFFMYFYFLTCFLSGFLAYFSWKEWNEKQVEICTKNYCETYYCKLSNFFIGIDSAYMRWIAMANSNLFRKRYGRSLQLQFSWSHVIAAMPLSICDFLTSCVWLMLHSCAHVFLFKISHFKSIIRYTLLNWSAWHPAWWST